MIAVRTPRHLHHMKIQVLQVGVTSYRYVSLRNCRPWVIHSFRNIRGRGLHVDEEAASQPGGDVTEPVGTEDTATAGTAHVDAGAAEESQAAKPSSKGETVDGSKSGSNLVGVAAPRTEQTSDEPEPASMSTTPPTQTVADADSVVARSPAVLAEDGTSCEGEQPGQPSDEGRVTESGSMDHRAAVSSPKPTVQIVDMGKLSTVKNQEKQLTTRRMLRKRKHSSSEEDLLSCAALPVSTYDKVRLVCQPWKKPEGVINKPVLRMILESALMLLMTKPGSSEAAICRRFSAYLQPVAAKNILQILEDLGCVEKQFLRKRGKVSLFSKPVQYETVLEEEEDDVVMYIPTVDCLVRLAKFGQETFQRIPWPIHQHFKHKRK